MLNGDPTRLVQVFANLLNNAAKYMEGSGQIHLKAGPSPERKRTAHGKWSSRSKTRVSALRRNY